MSIQAETVLKALDKEGVIQNTDATFPGVTFQAIQGMYMCCCNEGVVQENLLVPNII